MIVKCSSCSKVYRVHMDRLPEGVTSFPCRRCGTLLPVPRTTEGNGDSPGAAAEDAATLLVALNDEDLADLVGRILRGHDYRVVVSSTGEETLRMMREEPVDLLLINVFLPDMMAFEVIDRIRETRQGEGVPTILLSSIHHAARYKRAPTSLYGADEYIERHHLPDLLVPKIRRLLAGHRGTDSAVRAGRMPPPRDEQVLQRRELERIENAPGEPEGDREEGIRRLCRVIAGDIILYNEDTICEARPEDLVESLAGDLLEGAELLGKRYPGLGERASDLLQREVVGLLRSRGIPIP